jgi:HlyD family secretion protein
MEAMLKNNREILDNQSQLFTRNATPKRIYRDQEAAVLQGESNIASAKARLTELKNQFEADRADGESQIRLAKAALERAKADFAIESLIKQLALADVRVRRATIYAPVDGRILNLLARAGELVGTTAVLTMGNTEKMRAVAEVYETDIGRIKVGQKARIASRTLTTPVTGRVVEIGQMIFKNDVLNVDPAARADARIVEVRIELDDTERTQRLTNHTVDVIIDVGDMPVAQTSGANRGP